MKATNCQRCHRILFAHPQPKIKNTGLMRLDKPWTYKIKHTGKLWCQRCFWNLMVEKGIDPNPS